MTAELFEIDVVKVDPAKLKAWVELETKLEDGKSQNKLSKQLNVDRTTINSWKNKGRSALKKDSMTAIAKYMKVSFDEALQYFADDNIDVAVSRLASSDIEDKLFIYEKVLRNILETLEVLSDRIQKMESSNESARNSISKSNVRAV